MSSTRDGHCKEMLERFSEYLDGELDEACCDDLEKHLADCPECVRTVEGMRDILALCRQERKAPVDVKPAAEFKSRLRAVIFTDQKEDN